MDYYFAAPHSYLVARIYVVLAEPAGLAPHSNVYLSVPGGGSFLDKTVFPAYGVVVVWSEQEKWECLFANLGIVGGLGGGGVNYPRPVSSNATIVYPSQNSQVKP